MNRMQRLLIRMGLDGALRAQAEELANECAQVVNARLSGNTMLSSINEARGYVRARAATIIQRRVAEVQGLADDHRQQLRAMVADKLSDQFASQLLHRRVIQRKAA